jgi:hypothetical protein
MLIYIFLMMMQLRSCFGYDTFFANDVRRMGDGGIVIGTLRRPLEEVKPKLEASIAKACGREVDLWFMEETINEETRQVCCRALRHLSVFELQNKKYCQTLNWCHASPKVCIPHHCLVL